MFIGNLSGYLLINAFTVCFLYEYTFRKIFTTFINCQVSKIFLELKYYRSTIKLFLLITTVKQNL